MRRAKCFGINLARLDIRQESSRHSQLLNEFIKRKSRQNYNSWSEIEKIKYLSKRITGKNIINWKFCFQE